MTTAVSSWRKVLVWIPFTGVDGLQGDLRIRALELSAAPGLCIHATPITHLRTAHGRGYVVTHVESGRALLKNIERLSDALAVLRELASLGGWWRTREEIARDTDFCRSASERLNRISDDFLMGLVFDSTVNVS